MTTGTTLIAEERHRQMEVEGYTLEHDAGHSAGDLALAGACYALATLAMGERDWPMRKAEELWPWASDKWKPTLGDPIRQLTKAGALIAAEIDRRLEESASGVE